MGSYGGYYKGERRKLKKEQLEKRAQRIIKVNIIPKVEIIGKRKPR